MKGNFGKFVTASFALFIICPTAFGKEETPWPVSVAQDGFSAQQGKNLKSGYNSRQLGLAGNSALYTYLNMAEFYPHQLIGRDSDVKALPKRHDNDIGTIRVETLYGNLTLDELVSSPLSRLQGIVIVQHGKIIYEEYPGMRQTDSHLWWSVAKVLTGLLTEMLIEDGRIDPSQPIDDYLPQFKDSQWQGVRVEHILQQASGIDAMDSTEGYGNPTSGIGRLMFAQGILSAPGVVTPGHDQVLLEMQRLNPPGEKYQYSSANTNMLGLLIEKVTGKRYGDVVQERIWSQIGAEGDALLGLTPDGRAIAHGMFSSRLRDLARFGLVFTPSGHNPKIATKKLFARPDAAQLNKYYMNAPAAQAKDLGIHGVQPVGAPSQWDALFGDGDLFKSGFQGQALYVSPARDLVIAMFSTVNNPQAYNYFRALARSLDNNSVSK